MNGAFGRYVDVDLSASKICEYEPRPSWYPLHLGGRGIAARIILEEARVGSENEPSLVFATGPLQGTGLAGAGRHVVVGRSPKSGWIADSYAGGYVGHELGRSGYDGILIRGVASEPCYLLLENGQGKLLPADDLWGMNTAEVTECLTGRHAGGRVATIGPAGEREVQMACIMHDTTRAAGRPGFGAVMGRSRLKAIVVKGSVEKPLAASKAFARARARFGKALAEDPGLGTLGTLGTARGILGLNEIGILPTKNFSSGVFDRAESICGEAMADSILVGRETCFGCPIRCKRLVESSFRGRQVESRYGGPEYETIAAFGSLCLCDDLSAISAANQMCNAFGIDTISCGIAIAALMEASERGLIAERIEWGDGAALIEWTERIALREGELGDCIAEGPAAWARSIGDETLVQTIKQVELPMHDPRGKPGLGLSYAASPRGAAHMEGMHDTMLGSCMPTPELGVTTPVPRTTIKGKARVAVLYENLRSFTNSLVMCAFTNNMVGSQYNYPEIRALVGYATGRTLDADEMVAIGMRNMDIMRLSSGLSGHCRKHDDLPRRFYEPLPEGASRAVSFDRESFEQELDSYYEIRGWDDMGPTVAHLRSSGLSELCLLRNE